jgi:hypothetical protein
MGRPLMRLYAGAAVRASVRRTGDQASVTDAPPSTNSMSP